MWTVRWKTRRKLDNDPFIRQVMQDVEAVSAEERTEAEPPATVREIYEKYLPIVREKVLADKPYRNACRNSDREKRHDRGCGGGKTGGPLY